MGDAARDVALAVADFDAMLDDSRSDGPTLPSAHVVCRGCGGQCFEHGSSAGGDAGARVCKDCGVVVPGVVVYEHMYGNRIPVRTSNYKRIHHWHERISQLMLHETLIPSEDMLQIGNRLLDGTFSYINKDVIRAVLRSLGKQVYIERWLQIIQRTTGIMPPVPGPVILEQLDELFIELQRPFDSCKDLARRNFLNYNYVFARLLQKLDCTQFCMFFPMIRSKAKLNALDQTWDRMCQSLNWEYKPLQHVPTFSVRLDQVDVLRTRLASQCARQIAVVRPQAPSKTGYHKCLHHESTVARGQPERRRSSPPAQRPQTLALRLKRRRQEDP